MNEWVNVVMTLGFPTVACFGMGYFIYVLIVRLLNQMDRFALSLENFATTLASIDNRLGDVEDELRKGA